MKLSEYLSTQPRGALISIARAIGAHPPDVSDWVSNKRPVPLHRAVAIEQETGGAVTRRDLRPDDWMLIWPELAN
ncbi:MAG: YdaS family helix-turn-helix protein [Herbaspirillum sp.]